MSLESYFEALGAVALETCGDRLEERDGLGCPGFLAFAERLEIARDLRQFVSSLVGEAERAGKLAKEVLLFRIDLAIDTAEPGRRHIGECLVTRGELVDEQLFDADRLL